MTVDDLLDIARDTVAKVTFCWACTVGEDGTVNARVVQPMPLAPDWSVRFMTRQQCRKVRDVERTGRLSLGYQYDPEYSYVTLVGRTRLIDDVDYKRSIWTERSDRFYPGGPADPDVVVVHLDTERIEMWSSLRKVAPDPYGLNSAVLARDGGDWRYTETSPV